MCEYCRQSICPSSCPNAPEPPVFAECCECGAEILLGDDYYDINGDYYCEECIHVRRKTAEVEDV